MKKILYILVFQLITGLAFAQNPMPSSPQTKAIVLQGGTAHVGNGQVITNVMIRFESGKITYIGQVQDAVGIGDAEVINTTGKHIYPGLIAAYNKLGLTEIEAVRATNDHTEVGNINPHVRSLIAFNTDAEMIPTVRGNGILLTQATPNGGLITGQSSVMEMDGWNWEDAALKKDDGIHINWPGYIAGTFDPETFRFIQKKNDKRGEELKELDKTFNDAIAYAQGSPSVQNAKMEAMKGLFDGSKVMYVFADYGKEIIEAIQFAKAKGVKKITIIGGEEGLMAADYLKENNVPIIVSQTHRLPNRSDDDTDIAYKLPALYYKAGVQTSVGYLGLDWRIRNLPFVAGNAGGYGLTSEECLQMITGNTAKALGIDDMVGTLEKGKHATIVVSVGDILDMRTNRVEMAFIRGKKIDLDDKQKRLNKKFSAKFGK
jgi:imidazolonepropionase-like amidohydrolase